MTHRGRAVVHEGPGQSPPTPPRVRGGQKRKKLQAKFKEQKAAGTVNPRLKKRLNLSRIKNLKRRLTNRTKRGQDTAGVEAKLSKFKSKRAKLAGREKKSVEGPTTKGPPKVSEPKGRPPKSKGGKPADQNGNVGDRAGDGSVPPPRGVDGSESRASRLATIEERKRRQKKTAAQVQALNSRIAALRASGSNPEKLKKLIAIARARRKELVRRQKKTRKSVVGNKEADKSK